MNNELINQTQFLILVGGKGTRLKTVVSDLPKPLAPINEIPFLYFLLKRIQEAGFKHVCLLTGYKEEKVREFIDSEKFDLNVTYSHEESPLGTGGAIKKAIKDSSFQRYICLNGDTYFELNFNDFLFKSVEIKKENKNLCTIAINRMEDMSRYGAVTHESGVVTEFKEKDESLKIGYINAGVYMFENNIASYIGDGFVSLESEVFPKLLEEKKLNCIEYDERFIDIGIPEDFANAQKLLPLWAGLK